jgi:sterol desaturase/sphingolipid hydroxylase (fatty acid hydroxylase superfamily)
MGYLFEYTVPVMLTQTGQVAPVLLVAAFLLLLVLEFVLPLRKRTQPFRQRLAINAGISAVALVTGAFIARLVTLRVASWTTVQDFGLLHLLPVPVSVQVVLGVLLMDLTFYYWHRINHQVGLLWRFHNVHHIDPDLDVSTSFRFHVAEIAYSAVFRTLQVSLLGISPLVYLVYALAFQLATMFHHANLRLPIRAERILNKVLVTPRMHGIHHSTVKEEGNSNYSVVFRWWDALNATLRLNVPQSGILIGVPAYQLAEDNSFVSLLGLPFRRQRQYSRWPDGHRAVRETFTDASPTFMAE